MCQEHQGQRHEQVRQGLCPPGEKRSWNKQVLWGKWIPRNKCQEEKEKNKMNRKWQREGWLHFRGERRDHFDVMTSKQQTEDICQSKITTRRKRQANLKNRRYNIPVLTGIAWFVQETAKSSDSILRVTGSFWKILIKKSDGVIYVFKNTTLLLWDRSVRPRKTGSWGKALSQPYLN